jgi:hypothetical protein
LNSEKVVLSLHWEELNVAVALKGQVKVCGCKEARRIFASMLFMTDLIRGTRSIFSLW